MAAKSAKAKPCPFCGKQPTVFPIDPKREGNAWGAVGCINEDCPTYPTHVATVIMVPTSTMVSLETMIAGLLRISRQPSGAGTSASGSAR